MYRPVDVSVELLLKEQLLLAVGDLPKGVVENGCGKCVRRQLDHVSVQRRQHLAARLARPVLEDALHAVACVLGLDHGHHQLHELLGHLGTIDYFILMQAL